MNVGLGGGPRSVAALSAVYYLSHWEEVTCDDGTTPFEVHNMVSTLDPAKKFPSIYDYLRKGIQIMLEQPVQEARHAPFYDWMGVVTCSVSEATVGRPSKPSVDKERAGVSSQTIVMTFRRKVIRGRHRRVK